MDCYYNNETLSTNFVNLRRPESEVISAIHKIEGGFTDLDILDVGCGAGLQLDIMSKHNPNLIVGIDVSLPMLRKGKETLVKKFINSDALYLPFKNNTFDVITSIQSVHFVKSDKLTDLFACWNYCIKLGGRVYIVTHSTEQIKNRFESRFFHSITLHDLKRFHSIDNLLDLLSQNGFGGQKVITISSNPITINQSHLLRLETGVLSFMKAVPIKERIDGLKKMKSFIGQSFKANWTILIAEKQLNDRERNNHISSNQSIQATGRGAVD